MSLYESVEIASVVYLIENEGVQKLILKRLNGDLIELPLNGTGGGTGGGTGTGGGLPETPLSVPHGGTGAVDPAGARGALGAASATDPRLTDARTPTPHAASHAMGAADAVVIDASQITAGTLADGRIPASVARDTEVTSAVSAEATARDNAIAAAIANLIAAAPGTMDTLNELATALGDDPNFATTVTTALAGKLGISAHAANSIVASIGGTLADLNVPNSTILGRKATGNVVPLTPAELITLLGLAAVATTGSYNDLANKPTLGALAAKSLVAVTDLSFDPATQAELDAVSAAVALKETPAGAQAKVDVETAARVVSSNRRVPVIGSKLIISGHSIAAGGGSTQVDQSWGNILAALLRAEDVNLGKGSAVLSWASLTLLPWQWQTYPISHSTGDGGYPWFLNNNPVTERGVVWKGPWAVGITYYLNDAIYTGTGLTARYWRASGTTTGNDPVTDGGVHWVEMTAFDQKAGAWDAMRGFHIVNYGLNDLGWTKDLPSFLTALRTILSRIVSARYWFSNHPMFSKTGASWTANAQFNGSLLFQEGVLFQPLQSLAVGDTCQWQIPADWPGGTIRPHFLHSGSAAAFGGKLMITLDGVDVREIDFNTYRGAPIVSASGNRLIVWGEAVTVPAGKHVLGLRCTQAFPANGNVSIHGLSFDSPLSPPFVFVGLSKPLSYAAYSVPNPTDADVDTWNTGIAAMLAAEFPTGIFVTPTSISDKDPKKYTPDMLHPNSLGHRALAIEVYQALMAANIDLDHIFVTESEARIGAIHHSKWGAGIINGNNTSIPTGGAWNDINVGASGRVIEGTLPAAPGDVIRLYLGGTWDASPSGVYGYCDFATIVNGSRLNYQSSNNTAQSANGTPGCIAGPTIIPAGNGVTAPINVNKYAPLMSGVCHYVVQPNDLVGGLITIRPILKNIYGGTGVDGARLVFSGAGNPLDFYMENIGPMDPITSTFAP